MESSLFYLKNIYAGEIDVKIGSVELPEPGAVREKMNYLMKAGEDSKHKGLVVVRYILDKDGDFEIRAWAERREGNTYVVDEGIDVSHFSEPENAVKLVCLLRSGHFGERRIAERFGVTEAGRKVKTRSRHDQGRPKNPHKDERGKRKSKKKKKQTWRREL